MSSGPEVSTASVAVALVRRATTSRSAGGGWACASIGRGVGASWRSTVSSAYDADPLPSSSFEPPESDIGASYDSPPPLDLVVAYSLEAAATAPPPPPYERPDAPAPPHPAIARSRRPNIRSARVPGRRL